ncbi:hypothetical protein ABPG74_011556 [Tetrahymena malaccensis]
MITFSFDRTFAVQTYANGLILYNSVDIFNMYVYSQWQNLDFMVGENQGACITKDNNWVLSTIRLFGVYLLNVQNKTNPVLVDYYINSGGESVYISEISNYAYLVDGTKGFAIIDTSFFPKINIISRVELPGYTVTMLPLQDEQYILVTQEEKGMVTLIDIRNKQFPQIINTATYESQNSQSLCMTQTKDYIFLGASLGILMMPLFSDVYIHTDVNAIIVDSITGTTEIQQLQKATIIGNKINFEINDEYVFSVGQTIQFNFNILYPKAQNMRISKIYFYQNEEVRDLPSTFTFNIFEQSLQFYVDQSLQANNQVTPNLNIILIWTTIPLDKNSFQYSSEDSNDLGVTSSTQSALIYQYLLDQDVIDSNSIINENYDFNKSFKLDSQFQRILLDPQNMDQHYYQLVMSHIMQKINLTIKRSCYVNPIKFYVISSLTFNNSNSDQFISTNQQSDISIIIQINSSEGKLVQYAETSVVTYMTAQQDQLKIQGTLQNVNSILKKKVIFANNTQITTSYSPNVTITVIDNINYPLIQTFKIQESNFIVLKKQLQINQQNSLQYQIQQQYSDSIIDIESDISISFSQNTFFVSDSQQISYSFFYLNKNGTYVQTPANMWLQQQNDKLNFKGKTTSSMFGLVYKFKIVASDGYTQAEDYFYITVKGIPFQYLFNLLFKILGPLVAILGVYKQRYSLYNIIYKNKVTFSIEEAKCGQIYHKEIIFVGNIQEVAKNTLNKLFKAVLDKQKSQNQKDEQQISYNKNENEQDQVDQESSNYSIEFSKYQINKYSNFVNRVSKKEISKVIKNIMTFSKHKRNSLLEQKYLDLNGNLIFSKVVNDILSYNIFPKSNCFDTLHEFQFELNNQNSRIHRALRAQISRFFLSLDKMTQEIYEYIKFYCYSNNLKSQNDWFRTIVIIKYETENQIKNKDKVFPNLYLNIETLFDIFKTLNLFQNHEIQETPKNFQSLLKIIQNNKLDFNMYLLREVFYADALGFSQIKISSFTPSIGLSMHLNDFNISQIVAYKKVKARRWMKPILRILNLEYSRYSLSKNMKLPSWLQLDQKNGKMILHGIPQQYDIENILIRIYGSNGYVVQQFILKVKNDEKWIDLNINRNQIDVIYTVADEQEQSNFVGYRLSNTEDQNQNLLFEIKRQKSIFSERNESLSPNSNFFAKLNNEILPILSFDCKTPQSIKNDYEFKTKCNNKNEIYRPFNLKLNNELLMTEENRLQTSLQSPKQQNTQQSSQADILQSKKFIDTQLE